MDGKSKANSVQEPCVKYLVVHTWKFEILQTNMKYENEAKMISISY